MVLTAFLIGLVLGLVGLFVVIVRGFALWRQGKRTGGAITSELELFEERTARTEELLAEAERASRDLQAAAERLRVSRARLQVLLASLDTAKRRTRWLRAFLPASMRRVAAVDLGTNSTRLLVADVDGDKLDEVSRRLTITRLGEGVDERRRLLPVAIARVRNCLAEYRRELESLSAQRTLCIATSSVRDAENGKAFLGEIEWSYGFTTRLLSGTEEAAMMIRGVTSGRRALDDVLVVDIGGGSTELVLAEDGDVAFSTSLDVGCVRVTERFLGSDPPSQAELRPQAPTFARFSPSSRRRARSASPARSRPLGRSTSATTSTTRLERTATASARRGRESARTPRGDDDRGAVERPRDRARSRARDRRRRRRSARNDDGIRARRRSRCPSGMSSTAPRSPPPSSRARGGRCASRRLHLLLTGPQLRGRREWVVVLVFGKPPLEDASGQHADKPVVLVDDRDALGVFGLEEAERLLEGDLARA